MRRDLGAIFWPEVRGSQYGRVVPAEGHAISNRAILVGGTAAFVARAAFAGQAGSHAAWGAFLVGFLSVGWWGRTYYRHRGTVRPGRVLVVEDDPDALAMMDRLLRRRGWDVDLASSLGAAKEFLSREPAWVLIDVRLPDGSGLDLFRYLRSGPHAPKTMVMTATSDPVVQSEITAVRPTIVTYKPISDPRAILDSLGDPFDV